MFDAFIRCASAVRAVALASVLAVAGSFPAVAGPNLITNGDMEQGGESASHVPGWKDYRWEGDAALTHSDAAAFGGKRSALIAGGGPSKFAIWQGVAVAACSYEVRAKVAGKGLRAGQWGNSAAVYTEVGGQSRLWPLFTGDQGWRQMSWRLDAPEAGELVLYFFNYGPGAFFIDDVSVRAIDGCPKVGGEKRELAQRVLKPLDYTPPLSAEDMVLAGYCDQASMRNRPVCEGRTPADRSAAKPVRADAPVLLADFEGTAKVYPSGWSTSADIVISGEASARLRQGEYMIADLNTGVPRDWRGHGWLRFAVRNPSEVPQTVYVELNDALSAGYWSRANRYFTIPPGDTTLELPLQIFVGEKSVIRERRRIDLSQIERFVISAYRTTTDLIIDDVRLEPGEDYAVDFPELVKLDAGPNTSPLQDGFARLTAATYTARRGYGFSPRADIRRQEDRRHPDDLFRDWISIAKGSLDIDLPNGRYHVWMVLEDPGYWEYYPNFKRRRVFAERKPVFEERQSFKTFWEKYHRHADDEDLPGDDIWERYVRPRYAPLQFDVAVSDGQLNLNFASDGNPYALALSSLVIFPTSKRAAGEAFLADLMGKLKSQFGREYRELTPTPPSEAERSGNTMDGALSIFRRSPSVDVMATDWAVGDEETASLALTLAERQVVPFTTSLRASENLGEAKVSLEIDGFEIEGFYVRSKLSRVSQDGAVYRNAPRLLDPVLANAPVRVALDQGVTRRVWFDVRAGKRVRPGLHEGTLRIEVTGPQPRILERTVSVTLLPFALPKADVSVGYLGTAVTVPGTEFIELASGPRARAGSLRRRWQRDGLAMLADHGMTVATGGLGGPRFVDYDLGRLRLDPRLAKVTVDAVRAAGFGRNLNTYAGLELVGLPHSATDKVERGGGRSYETVLRDVLQAIDAQSLPVTFEHSIADEPSEEDMTRVLAVAQAFRAADPNARTGAFTSFRDPSSDKRAQFAGQVTRIYMNEHTEEALRHILEKGSECALYNRFDRYHRGIYLLRLKELGCDGHLQFAFSSVHADPWYDLDGREDEQVAVFLHRDKGLRATLDLKRFRGAIDDYRYLMLLQRTIADAPSTADVGDVAAARTWLAGTLAKMEIGSEAARPWSTAEIDGVRAEAIAHLQRLLGPSG